VHLELHLLRVDHDRRHLRRARVGSEERRRLLADTWGFSLQCERVDVLPAGLRARAAVGARVAADLRDPVARGRRVDPAAALDQLLVGRRPFGGDEHALLALRPHERGGDLHVVVRHALFGAETVSDLVRERDLERVLLDRRAVLTPGQLHGSERAAVSAGRGLRKGARLGCRGLRAVRAQAPVAGEAPSTVDQRADAEALALHVVEPVDPPVPRRDRLRPAKNDPGVCVGGSGGERRGDRLFAELAHRENIK
jgi:hypothetical protein